MRRFTGAFLLLTSAVLMFFTLADETSDDASAKDPKVVNSCQLKLRNGGGCEGEECPYQLTLPPMSLQLPKQFGLLEKTLKEVQSLKETVNKLKSCQDCKLQADENQDSKGNELQVPESEDPTESGQGRDNKIQDLQSKYKKMSISLKNARSQISVLQTRLEKLSPASLNDLEHYVDSKVENLTYLLTSLDTKCSSNCPATGANPGFDWLSLASTQHSVRIHFSSLGQYRPPN